MDNERIAPVVLTDNKTDVKYTLDFSRDSIVFAENRGFRIDQVSEHPVSVLSDLFFYSFRMYHRNVARSKTDDLLKRMGCMSESLATRLVSLYIQAQTSNSIQSDEDFAKNAEVTVEL